jgi:hypothetical protein
MMRKGLDQRAYQEHKAKLDALIAAWDDVADGQTIVVVAEAALGMLAWAISKLQPDDLEQTLEDTAEQLRSVTLELLEDPNAVH